MIGQRENFGEGLLRLRNAMKQEAPMKNRMLTGAVLATTVGLMFLARPVLAQENSMSGQQSQVKCVGANDCKGKSSCKSAQNDCKGKNACKGKGFIQTSSTKECTDKGGHPENM
jgi:hypothetical protein